MPESTPKRGPELGPALGPEQALVARGRRSGRGTGRGPRSAASGVAAQTGIAQTGVAACMHQPLPYFFQQKSEAVLTPACTSHPCTCMHKFEL